MIRLFLLYIVLFFSINSRAYCQAHFTASVDSLLYQYITNHDIPSVAVGIVYSDTVIYENIIALENQDDKSDSDRHIPEIYNIASVAKPFTALAIMMLVQEGKINLSDQVVFHIPYFQVDSKYSHQITIEQLLTHTSGLPDVSHPDVYKYLNPDISEDALENHVKSLSTLKLKFMPGKKYAYSNVGYEILGDVISKISSMSFEGFMKLKIFQPMGMSNTSYRISDFQESQIAKPHTGHPFQETENFPYDLRFTPSGNLFTTIKDLNHWLIFNLNGGQYHGFRPISDENYSLFTKPRIDTKDDGFKTLGWFVKETNLGKIYFHDGMDLGYRSLIVLMPKPRIGITVVVNHQEVDCNEILNLIIKTIRY